MAAAGNIDQSALHLQTGIGYYGDEQLYVSQLSTFDTLTLNPSVDRIHQAWKSRDLKTLEKEAGKVKRSAT